MKIRLHARRYAHECDALHSARTGEANERGVCEATGLLMQARRGVPVACVILQALTGTLPVPCLAQSGASTPPASGMLGGRSDAAPAAEAAQDARVREARAIIARAESLFAAGHYDGALSEFLRAHQVLSGHARRGRLLNNIAVCYERLHRYEEAIKYYQRYLDEADPAPTDRREVQVVIRTLTGFLATVTIVSEVQATVWLDRHRVGKAPGSVRVTPGRHTFEVRAADHESGLVEVVVAAGERKRVVVELTPIDPFRGVDTDVFLVGVGVTASLVVATAVVGIYALDQKHRFRRQAAAAHHIQTAELLALEREVSHLETASNIGLVGIGVSGVATLILGLLSNWKDWQDDVDTQLSPAVRVALEDRTVALHLGGVLP